MAKFALLLSEYYKCINTSVANMSMEFHAVSVVSITVCVRLYAWIQFLFIIWHRTVRMCKRLSIKIMQRTQNKTLRSIVNAPWYVSNQIIYNGLPIDIVYETIKSSAIGITQRLMNTQTLGFNILRRTAPTVDSRKNG